MTLVCTQLCAAVTLMKELHMVRFVVLFILVLGGCVSVLAEPSPLERSSAHAAPIHIIPQPLVVTPGEGSFTLGSRTVLAYHGKEAEARKSVEYLATLLR